MKSLICTILLLLLAGALTSTATADTLKMVYSSAPKSVETYKNGNSPSASLNMHIYEGLLAKDGKANLTPLLATSWQWTDDTTLVMTLRQGVKFHNGDTFTARDVVYSACRMMFKPKGKRAYLHNSLKPVQDVVAVDDYTVQFKTGKPYPILPMKLFYLHITPAGLSNAAPGPIAFSVPSAEQEKKDKAAKKDSPTCGITRYPTTLEVESGGAAIGTGPYKLVKFEATGNADLVRNDQYWGESGKWQEVQIRSVKNPGSRMAGLLSGDFDCLPIRPFTAYHFSSA